MKKFLSLVLAMIMAMSLVTISAGAVEYDELSDKDEITYEEAVAVLNKIGIIEGYPDGSYKPEGLLTRQVAAKFIVSLLIGPEAAENLTAAVAPYPDVPVSSQFAGYISYCKTANIISGYTDGMFRPEGSLTGYAFAKMLLGAIGYRGDIEGFTGTGWTMNVARLGSAANLFDRLQFAGGEPVNREEAAQLCLNTLKATMVEYSGGFNVSAGDATVTGAVTRSYVTSNQEYARHISSRFVTTTGNNISSTGHHTVEFGEEHFKDLRLNGEHVNETDAFGRPSNVWSWKKVTIGVFPIAPDFLYTEQVAAYDDVKVTNASKVRALGLNGYKVNDDGIATQVLVNGRDASGAVADAADIANFTDNGTVVEVYVSEDVADVISHVVVVHTQLMQIKKLGAGSVSLKKYDDKGANGQLVGFNNKDSGSYVRLDNKVNDVEVTDDCYEFLNSLKVDDIVAIVPLTEDEGETYAVAAAYQPKTVTGALTGSTTFANSTKADDERTVVDVTVGGTTYKVATWNRNLNNINRDILKVTKKDVTLYLDEFGNAMLAKNVGDTNDYMILGSWKSAVVNNVIVRVAEGWDIKGNPVSLNVGSNESNVVKTGYKDFHPGDVLRYTNKGATGDAEWKLTKDGVYTVPGNALASGTEGFAIKASNRTIKLDESTPTATLAGKCGVNPLVSNSIKTIYVSFDNGEVDFIEVKDGLQNVTSTELQVTEALRCSKAEATISLNSSGAVTEDSDVTALVIKRGSNDASLKNLAYVYGVKSTNKKDEDGNIISNYKVFTQDDGALQMESASNGIDNRMFVRCTELENDLYRLRAYNKVGAGTSTMTATISGLALTKDTQKNNNMYRLDPKSYEVVGTDAHHYELDDMTSAYRTPNISKVGTFGALTDLTDLAEGDLTAADLITVKGAKFLDITSVPAEAIDTAKELRDAVVAGKKITVDIAFNDNPNSDDFRMVYIIVITKVEDGDGSQTLTGNGFVTLASGLSSKITDITGDTYTIDPVTGEVLVNFDLKIPDWASVDVGGQMKINYQLSYGNSASTAANYLSRGTIGSKDFDNKTPATHLAPDAKGNGNITKFYVRNFKLLDSPSYATLLAGKVIVMKITGVSFGSARIQYVSGNNVPLYIDSSKKVAALTTDDSTATKGGDQNLWLDGLLKTGDYTDSATNATFSVSNAKWYGNDGQQDPKVITSSNSGRWSAAEGAEKNSYYVADGDGWVTVTVYNLNNSTLKNLTTSVDTSGKSLLIQNSTGGGAGNGAVKLGDVYEQLTGDATYNGLSSTIDVTITPYSGNTESNSGFDGDTGGTPAVTNEAQLVNALTVGNGYMLDLTVTQKGDSGYYAIVTWTVTNGGQRLSPRPTKMLDLSGDSQSIQVGIDQLAGDLKIDVDIKFVDAPVASNADISGLKASGGVLTFQVDTEIDLTGTYGFNKGCISVDNGGSVNDDETPCVKAVNMGDYCLITVQLNALSSGDTSITLNSAVTAEKGLVPLNGVGVKVTNADGTLSVSYLPV